jgi:hypothetical protein
MTLPESFGCGPERIAFLRRVLDEAWESLSLEQRAFTSKSILALRILKLANRGETRRVASRSSGFTNRETPNIIERRGR